MSEDKTAQTPLILLAPQIFVLTLPQLPKKTMRIRDHLLGECAMPEDRIHFFEGQADPTVDLLMDRFSDQELSLLDALTLSPMLHDRVGRNITENHLRMIRHAHDDFPDCERGWCMFLEDDARFDRSAFSIDQARWVEYSLRTNPRLEVILLGGLPFWGSTLPPVGLYDRPYMVHNISRTLTAHAYILTRRGMEKFLAATDRLKDRVDRIPFDQWFYEADMTVHTVFPMICFPCREPALYRRVQSMMPPMRLVSFRRVCETMLIVAVLLPVILTVGFIIISFVTVHRLRTIVKNKKMQSL